MRFLLLFILGLCLSLTAGRPSQQAEEGDRDNGEAEYNESDIASAQDYIQDERGIEKKGVQGSNEHEDSQNDEEVMIYSESIANRPSHKSNKQFLDEQKSSDRNMRDDDIVNEDSLSNKKGINVLKGMSHHKQPLVPLTNRNAHNTNEFDSIPAQGHEESELIFKNYSEDKKNDLNENRDEVEEINQRSISSLRKEPYNARVSAMRPERKLDDAYCLERDRRQVSSSDENVLDTVKNVPKDKDIVSDSISNPTSNTEDIKELSKQDLEDLLNSLSSEKINILKKIISDNENINKREVTKKSAALADDSYVDSGRGDVTGFYSITDLHTDSNKNAEGFDSSKRSDFDSPTTKSENNDNDISAIKQDKSKLSETQTGIINTKDQSKVKESVIENVKDLKNEKKRDIDSGEQSNLKINDYKEFGIDQDSHCNNDWLDAEDNSETQKLNKKFKREISDAFSSDLSGSLRSLEESFPTLNSDGVANIKSDLTPLVRVKRTSESNNKDGDLNIQHSDAFLAPLLPDNDDLERDEKNEIEDYGLFGQEKHLLINDNPEKLAEKQYSIQLQDRAKNHDVAYDQSVKNIRSEIDNISIGSDTDRVLSSVEGVDENLMYKSGARRKRMQKNLSNDNLINNCDKKMYYDRQLTNKDENTYIENSENVSQLNEADNLGQISENKDVSRYKRIREIKYADPNI